MTQVSDEFKKWFGTKCYDKLGNTVTNLDRLRKEDPDQCKKYERQYEIYRELQKLHVNTPTPNETGGVDIEAATNEDPNHADQDKKAAEISRLMAELAKLGDPPQQVADKLAPTLPSTKIFYLHSS